MKVNFLLKDSIPPSYTVEAIGKQIEQFFFMRMKNKQSRTNNLHNKDMPLRLALLILV